MKKVMIFGTFDLLHIGHLKMIKQASKLGDKLVAVIARDTTVRSVKNKNTIHTEDQRKEILDSLSLIDEAKLGYKNDVYKIIQEEKPDMIALGYDQTHFVDNLEDKLEEFGLNTRIVRLEGYKQDEFKTSKIRNKLNIN